jgi:hypothetical protein
MGISSGYLTSLLDRMQSMPIEEIMRQDERERGNRVVKPGDEPWLLETDWPDHIVISVTSKREVRIIAIIAKKPGAGAFTRLVGLIRSAGLVPVVLAPSNEMRTTLRRWRWRQRYVGHGFDSEEQWRPPRSPE